MEIVDTVFQFFLILLFAGILSGRIAKILRVPDVMLYLLCGILIGKSGFQLIDIRPQSPANQLIVVFGTAFILFHGGVTLKLEKLRETGMSIFLLATIGVLVTVACIGGISLAAGVLPLIYGLLLGSVLAPTDPATLIPIFNQIKVPERLRTLIEGEAGFNDPAGAVLVFLLLGQIAHTNTGFAGIAKFLGMQVVGSIVLGILVGLLLALLINEKWEHLIDEFTPLTILLAVLGGFFITDKLSGSGYLAVFVAGIVVGNIHHLHLSIRHKYLVDTHTLSKYIFEIMKMFIFLILGSHIDLVKLRGDILSALMITVALVFIVRPIVVLLCLKAGRRTAWTWSEVLFVSWIRETGVMPAALASLLISQQVTHATYIANTTFVVILFTLLVQASTTGILARKLKLAQ